jgi:hypothetical protein
VTVDVLLELKEPEATMAADAVRAQLAGHHQPVDRPLAHAEVQRHAALGEQRLDLRIVVDGKLGEVRHAVHTHPAGPLLSDRAGPSPNVERPRR